ncbi:hypothetical protein PMW_91 [Pseudomonas phage phiPMW]|uniref:Uncharacterized protein n=1 Tax=Pseudomonas phage phiPMW TaxID=1815582 RepID=A0A1S5R1D3_9CAUD|nr:hypothetical protein FDG97_gp091 [Pseudomonas phage phiPMW]ANA49216.1 hypothetical protein PMW_91 [Pseudomonas phage phiPMW]
MKIVVTSLKGVDGGVGDAVVYLYGKCGYVIDRVEFDGELLSGEYTREIPADIDSVVSHMSIHSGTFEYRIEA